MKTYYNTILALVLLLSFIPVTDAAFCDGDFLMENVSVDDAIITVSGQLCTQGCLDEALLTFGEPGCQENEVIKWLMIAGVSIVMTFIISRVFR